MAEDSDNSLSYQDSIEQRTIWVEKLPDDIDQELLEMYFENPKSGGGEIERISMEKEGSAMIIFKEKEGKLWLDPFHAHTNVFTC